MSPGDRITYQPRGPRTRLVRAKVREVREDCIIVVGPRGFAAIRPEAVKEVRGCSQ